MILIKQKPHVQVIRTDLCSGTPAGFHLLTITGYYCGGEASSRPLLSSPPSSPPAAACRPQKRDLQPKA